MCDCVRNFFETNSAAFETISPNDFKIRSDFDQFKGQLKDRHKLLQMIRYVTVVYL